MVGKFFTFLPPIGGDFLLMYSVPTHPPEFSKISPLKSQNQPSPWQLVALPLWRVPCTVNIYVLNLGFVVGCYCCCCCCCCCYYCCCWWMVMIKARKNIFLPKKYFLHILAVLKENKIFWHFCQKTTYFDIFKGKFI